MKINAKSPCRVDLAGGTLDIWPLYLYHANAVTVNFAVDRYTSCELVTRSDRKVVLRSADQRAEETFESLAALRHGQSSGAEFGSDGPAQARAGGLPVRTKDFAKLVASVKQAGRIRRGRMKASRSFEVRPIDIRAIRQKLDRTAARQCVQARLGADFPG